MVSSHKGVNLVEIIGGGGAVNSAKSLSLEACDGGSPGICGKSALLLPGESCGTFLMA